MLGTLSAHEAQAVTAALETDAELARSVAGWECGLAPLSALAPAAATPPTCGSRIERTLDALAPAPPLAVPGVQPDRQR